MKLRRKHKRRDWEGCTRQIVELWWLELERKISIDEPWPPPNPLTWEQLVRIAES